MEQHWIAEQVWSCETQEDLDALLARGGPEYVTIRDLIVHAALDEVKSCEDAKEMLAQFRL